MCKLTIKSKTVALKRFNMEVYGGFISEPASTGRLSFLGRSVLASCLNPGGFLLHIKQSMHVFL